MCSVASRISANKKVTCRHWSDKLGIVSAPERSNQRAQRRPVPRPSPGPYQRRPVPNAYGVPLAPSFLDLEDEDTIAYDARRTPVMSMPALRTEYVDTSKWSGPTVADARTDRRRGRRSEPSIPLSDDDIEILSPPYSEVVRSEV